MIECLACRMNLDVDEDVASELGWSYEAMYDTDDEGFPLFIGNTWFCPGCSHVEIN